MKRLRILLVGVILLALFGFAWATRNSGEVLTSYTFVQVNAPAEKVWSILTDVAAYPQWNPYITEVEGTLRGGAKLKVVEVVNGKKHSHKVEVTRFQPSDHQLLWQGSLVWSRLLEWGEWFSVEAINSDQCRVVMMNSHQGLLAKLYWKYYKNRDLQAYREFGAALKKKAEQ